MTGNRKRAFAAFLAAALVLVMVPGVALGETKNLNSNEEYQVTNNQATVTYKNTGTGSITLNVDDTGDVTIAGVTGDVELEVTGAADTPNVLDGLSLQSSSAKFSITSLDSSFVITLLNGSVGYTGDPANTIYVKNTTSVAMDNAVVTVNNDGTVTVEGEATIVDAKDRTVYLVGEPKVAGKNVTAIVETDGGVKTAYIENVVSVECTSGASFQLDAPNGQAGIDALVYAGDDEGDSLKLTIAKGKKIQAAGLFIIDATGISEETSIVQYTVGYVGDPQTGHYVHNFYDEQGNPLTIEESTVEGETGGTITLGAPAPIPPVQPQPTPVPTPETFFFWGPVKPKPTPTPSPVEIPEVIPEEIPRTGPESTLAGFAMVALAAGLLLLRRRRS